MSNGVCGMENSAMILRVKFKTLPGHQFPVQKKRRLAVEEAARKKSAEGEE